MVDAFVTVWANFVRKGYATHTVVWFAPRIKVTNSNLQETLCCISINLVEIKR